MREYVELEGSERAPRTGDRIVGRPDLRTMVQITVHVKPEKDQLPQFVSDLSYRPSSARQHLTRAQFAEAHGASSSDLGRIRRFALEHGLRVVPDAAARMTHSSESAHRSVELRGTLGNLSRAFHIQFHRYHGPDGYYRGYTGAVHIPADLQGLVQNVLGLDNRPQAKTRFRQLNSLGGMADSPAQSYSPDQVAKLYNFPAGVTGKGQTIAIIELGGGYREKDLRRYFKTLGMNMPRIQSLSVAGGKNSPTGDPASADGEVMLDIEVCGAVAPGARLVVYFAKNTNRGFFRAVNTAIHDDRHKPTVLSISWGGPEGSWRAADMDSMDTAFQAATAMGVSVCVAAGDGGSSDDVEPGSIAHVDFPASSPFATACGGTRLQSSDGVTIDSETVWNDGPSGGGTGGGISAHFKVPLYQQNVTLPAPANPGSGPGRAVPDVAGDADPWTGYKVRVDAVDSTVGGTSAVAPLWAGLTALLNEALQRQVGFLNPMLYYLARTMPNYALRDITVGDNDTTGMIGSYQAQQGYDACSGLGTPNGAALLAALK